MFENAGLWMISWPENFVEYTKESALMQAITILIERKNDWLPFTIYSRFHFLECLSKKRIRESQEPCCSWYHLD